MTSQAFLSNLKRQIEKFNKSYWICVMINLILKDPSNLTQINDHPTRDFI